MKRISFIFAALLCSSLCFAQMKVYQNGNVGIGSTLTTTDSHLNIGNLSLIVDSQRERGGHKEDDTVKINFQHSNCKILGSK